MKRILVTLMAMSLVGTVYAEEAVRCDGTSRTLNVSPGTSALELEAQVVIILNGQGSALPSTIDLIITLLREVDGTLVKVYRDSIETLAMVKPERSDPAISNSFVKLLTIDLDGALGSLSVSCDSDSNVISSGNPTIELETNIVERTNSKDRKDRKQTHIAPEIQAEAS